VTTKMRIIPQDNNITIQAIGRILREELFLLTATNIITAQGETSTYHRKVITILHIVSNIKEERIVSQTIRKLYSCFYPSVVLLDSRDINGSNIKETHVRPSTESIAKESLIIKIIEKTIIIEDIATQVIREESIIRDMMIEKTKIE